MADNSSIPVAVGNETFANKDIAGVKFPKHILHDSAGAEVVPATQTTAAAILAKLIAAPATEAKQDSAIVQETAIAAVLGTTSGAAVTTSTTGTVQQYLRGIVSLLVSGITVATHAVTQSGSWVLSAGTAVIGKVDHTTTGIGHGKKVVTTAGTDVALASSTAAKWVTIQAYRANTAMIAVGAAGVDAAASNGDGVTLAAGESITLAVDNLADVFIDATVNGEGVRFTYGS